MPDPSNIEPAREASLQVPGRFHFFNPTERRVISWGLFSSWVFHVSLATVMVSYGLELRAMEAIDTVERTATPRPVLAQFSFPTTDPENPETPSAKGAFQPEPKTPDPPPRRKKRKRKKRPIKKKIVKQEQPIARPPTMHGDVSETM